MPNQTGSENSYHPKKYNNASNKKYTSGKVNFYLTVFLLIIK